MSIWRWWAYEHSILCARDLQPSVAAIPPRIETTFAEAGADCAPLVASAMGLSSPDLVLTRLGAGKRCFVALSNGEVAAYGWVSQCEEIGELERNIRLPAGEAYIWDCATQHSYRGLRLYSALLASIASRLRKEGMRRVWIGASVTNSPSMRGIMNSGFTPVLSLRHMRFLLLRCLVLRPEAAAPAPLVAAARRALCDPQEYRWGPLALGRRRRSLFGPAAIMCCDHGDGDA